MRGKDVKRRRDELDLDGGIWGVLGLSLAECLLDGVDSLVSEAGNLDVGADLGGLGSKTLGDVGGELLLDNVGGKLDSVPDIGVAIAG